MSAADLNLVVVSTPQLGAVRAFYESVGVRFLDEQHGRGPPHVVATLASGLALEIYPSAVGNGTGTGTALDVRLGFAVDDLDVVVDRAVGAGGRLERRFPDRAVLLDPDGRVVILSVRVARTTATAIAEAYWAHYRDPDLGVWAWELVNDLGRGRTVEADVEPLELFATLARTAVDSTALAYLGAGPLEDHLGLADLDLDALGRAVREHDALARAFMTAYLPEGLSPLRADRLRRALGWPAEGAWLVMREDDHGTTFEVARCTYQDEAEERLATFEGGTYPHRQRYWVEHEPPRETDR